MFLIQTSRLLFGGAFKRGRVVQDPHFGHVGVSLAISMPQPVQYTLHIYNSCAPFQYPL